MAHEHTIAIFLAELILLLFFGRVLGEGMNRIGQPAIFGQLLAGVLLGPSVFGAIAPTLRQTIFPDSATLKSMIDAVSQIGILLLLLLTGMETNLGLVKRKSRAVIATSLSGIAVPFVCGFVLAYALPDSVIPSPETQLLTALFLGTALSISSVKIVAMVLMEVGAIRRDLGQLILATAILDDTIAWILIAVIAGIAAHGAINPMNVGASLAGTAIFLGASLTVGRRAVARIIRWSNDELSIEMPVITAILLVMLVMALMTDLIGVHTALGAFVAGILVGQSPILTEHIERELRGFIVAFFSPVFFAVAGLAMDLRTLLEPTLLLFTLAVVVVASVGKFAGALVGGRLGGLTNVEALALATGLNARGSTEVIIASIGLSMGALGNQLYTMIVAMAVVTTMVMPPTLRWALQRVPLREQEAKRLEREGAEARQSVPKMERALAYFDASPNGTLAGLVAGMFAAGQQVMTTVMESAPAQEDDSGIGSRVLERAAAIVLERNPPGANAETAAPPMTLEELINTKPAGTNEVLKAEALRAEALKGYSIGFVGVEQPIAETTGLFTADLQGVLDSLNGPVAIAFNARFGTQADPPREILIPTGGTPEARLAMEIALVIAKAGNGRLTALHVIDPHDDAEFLRGRARRQGLAVLADARRLGKRCGVSVSGVTVTSARPEVEIRRAARSARYDLVVLGTALRQGKSKFLGPGSSALVRALPSPVLLIVR